ncbi:MAG: hypothetical protein KAT70_06960, partial [Thermoplasmata archaeon]|nr:hypothetical protein [Thermoplasmata archaeon]
MIYSFIKGAIEEKGGPVTTKEIEDFARIALPMCADHVMVHITDLEEKGIVVKELDMELKAYLWSIPIEYTVEEL